MRRDIIIEKILPHMLIPKQRGKFNQILILCFLNNNKKRTILSHCFPYQELNAINVTYYDTKDICKFQI